MRSSRAFALSGVFACAGTVLLVLCVLLIIVEASCFDPGYYEREYAKNDAAAYVGVSQETLNEATVVLLEYLEGKRPTLDLEVRIDGQTRQYYNEREKAHMADVRDLNEGAVTFMWISGFCGAALVGTAFGLAKSRWRVSRVCFWSILGVLGAFGIIGIWAAADFSSFWTSFHHVFFRNDLWLFDPRSSLLIRMFELQFFFDLVAQILVWFLSICAVALAAAGISAKRGRRVEAAA